MLYYFLLLQDYLKTVKLIFNCVLTATSFNIVKKYANSMELFKIAQE